MEKPQSSVEKNKFALYGAGYQLSRLALWAMYEQHVEGMENIQDIPGIFAMNHQKVEDTFLLAKEYTKATGKPMALVAQEGYFNGDGIRGKDGRRHLGKTVKLIVNSIGAISADREGTMSGVRQLSEDVTASIKEGVSVGVHPDATRSENGMVNKFYPLFTRLAYDLNVPIYPFGGHYSRGASPLRSKHVDLKLGKPLMPEYMHSARFRLLPMNKRIEHFNNELEKRTALAANLQQSGLFAPRSKNGTPAIES